MILRDELDFIYQNKAKKGTDVASQESRVHLLDDNVLLDKNYNNLSIKKTSFKKLSKNNYISYIYLLSALFYDTKSKMTLGLFFHSTDKKDCEYLEPMQNCEIIKDKNNSTLFLYSKNALLDSIDISLNDKIISKTHTAYHFYYNFNQAQANDTFNLIQDFKKHSYVIKQMINFENNIVNFDKVGGVYADIFLEYIKNQTTFELIYIDNFKTAVQLKVKN